MVEQELRERYPFIHGNKALQITDHSWTNWWNPAAIAKLTHEPVVTVVQRLRRGQTLRVLPLP